MHRSYDEEDTGQRFVFVLDLRSRSKSEIMYLLINASPPIRLDVATSNFADALVSSKRVFAMVYHQLKSSFFI